MGAFTLVLLGFSLGGSPHEPCWDSFMELLRCGENEQGMHLEFVEPQIPVASQRGTTGAAMLVGLPTPCFVGFGREIRYFQMLKTPGKRLGNFVFCWRFWLQRCRIICFTQDAVGAKL